MRCMKTIAVFVSACLVFSSCSNSKKQVISEPLQAGYSLIWADEFDKEGKADHANWRHEKGFVRNEEFQWYQEENAYCKNGILVIEARRETKPNPAYNANESSWKKNRKNAEYTSSSINTSGKHSWKYGRFI